ncbi:MAG TPA: septum formation initiator family protein [Thermodesulfobacteriota bacterium]|jgi:cell division protein FtsB
MRDFRHRRRAKKFLNSPRFVLILVVLVIIIGQGAWGVYKKERESEMNLEDVRGELERTREREEELSQQIEYLHTDKGIEGEIREKFSVVKPGEEVVIIIEDRKAESETDSKQSFLERLWNGIKGIFNN